MIVGTVRVYHCNGTGQRILALVMVGDNQVDAQRGAKLGLLNGGDAAIHGDDECDTLPLQLLDGNGVQAIAFLQAAGNVGNTMHPVAAQEVGQQAGGGDAVHIVVAENGNGFALGHGQGHAGGSQIHVLHGIGRDEGSVTAQILLGSFCVSNASGSQDHGG